MSTPAASSAAPVAPTAAAAPQGPPAPIGIANPALGAAQPTPAPPVKRSRNPQKLVPASGPVRTSGAPALLELGAAVPLATIQRRSVNYNVPDANFLFHVLGICDSMMNATHRFTQSAPAWIPIVSQLYIAVLWNYQILKVYVNSTYGYEFSDFIRNMDEILNIGECQIPGPLVPFFEALAAVNGPFDWIGDVVSALPDFAAFWDAGNWITMQDYRLRVPLPVVLLDQLAYFGTWNIPQNQTIYNNFEWYRNVFSVASSTANNTLRQHMLSPPACGTLYTTEGQANTARSFWNATFTGFTRVDAAPNQPALTNYAQLFGFQTQTGTTQLDWFQHVAVVMQTYCKYMNGSRPIKSISPTGLGTIEVVAIADSGRQTRNWLYPQDPPSPFLSSRFNPIHEIPSPAAFNYEHSDHDLEEVAEQYAIITTTNTYWTTNILPQHGWNAYDDNLAHSGTFWTMMKHRRAQRVNIKVQYAQLVASRYHQTVANKAE